MSRETDVRVHPDWLVPEWPAPAGVRALITTRVGGVSTGPYASFNVGYSTADDPHSTEENRARLSALRPAATEQRVGFLLLLVGEVRAGRDHAPRVRAHHLVRRHVEERVRAHRQHAIEDVPGREPVVALRLEEIGREDAARLGARSDLAAARAR